MRRILREEDWDSDSKLEALLRFDQVNIRHLGAFLNHNFFAAQESSEKSVGFPRIP
jgi:hypothetical protein